MKIALFGGTFNPVHNGHLLIAEAARDDFDLDRVVFLPTGEPPHKAAPKTAARHRLAMLRLALSANQAFEISDWELRQQRVVYTYEALAYFARQWSRHQRYFLTGSDSLAQLPTWRRGAALLKECPFLIVERPEAPWSRLPLVLRRGARRVHSEPVPFSSRAIRRRVNEGRSIRYQVPDAVGHYIRAHRLYREAE